MYWYFKVFRSYFNFSGRARRKEYWYFTLFYVVSNMLAFLTDVFTGTYHGEGFGVLSGTYFLVSLFPTIGVSIRRLHDIGHSGWWMLINLIPGVGSLAICVIALFDSQPGPNEYGPNPKEPIEAETVPDTLRCGSGKNQRGIRWIKGIGIAVSLMAVLVLGVQYWWGAHKDQLMADGKAAIEFGKRAGQSRTEVECVEFALQRHRENPSISLGSSVSNSMVLTGCLETGAPTQSFCDHVPPQTEIVASGQWIGSACNQAGITDGFCASLLQRIPVYCASDARHRKINGEAGATRNSSCEVNPLTT